MQMYAHIIGRIRCNNVPGQHHVEHITDRVVDNDNGDNDDIGVDDALTHQQRAATTTRLRGAGTLFDFRTKWRRNLEELN